MTLLDFFMPVIIVGVVSFPVVSYLFSRRPFWRELSNIYGCSIKEFRTVSELPVKHSRFCFYEESWESDNQINVKMDQGYLYLGPYYLLSFFIKPIKVPISDLVYKGNKVYWLTIREVYEFKEVQGYKIAVVEGVLGKNDGGVSHH